MVVLVTVATTTEVDFVKRISREAVEVVVVEEEGEEEVVVEVEKLEKRKGRKSHPLIWMLKWKLIWPLVPN